MPTKIEWTDETWNPIRGCSRVSEGCRNCYAERMAGRFCGPGQPFEGLVTLGAGKPKWNGQIRFVEEHLLDPLKWRSVRTQTEAEEMAGCYSTRPKRIFVNSMSDLFHPGVTDEMLDRIFAVMALCPQHTFQVLTKRPERMLAYLASDETAGRLLRTFAAILDGCEKSSCKVKHLEDGLPGLTLPNVWLGVSVENQTEADERIPLLLQTPAAMRFISAEPLLGAINLRRIDWVEHMKRDYAEKAVKFTGELKETLEQMLQSVTECKWEEGRAWRDALTGAWFDGWDGNENPEPAHSKLDWVICGGESGPGARPMHPDWARGLRDACVAAGVPFFFKQWGEWAPTERGEGTTVRSRSVLQSGQFPEARA